MGNRVSTSTTPFSLEDLEAIARSPPLGTSTSNISGVASSTTCLNTTPPSLLDAVAADLAAAVSTPSSNTTVGTNANARKIGSGSSSTTTQCVIDSNSINSLINSSTVHLRKENIKTEIEQQFADVDTSLHALRCVPDFSRGRRLPLLYAPASRQNNDSNKKVVAAAASSSERRGSRHSDPVGGTGDPGFDNDHASNVSMGVDTSKANADGSRHIEKCGGVNSGRPAKRRTNSTRVGTFGASKKAPSNAAADAASSATFSESPRSWIFRDVVVQPVDLTQAVEVGPSEVYVVVLVQRATAVVAGNGSGGSLSTNSVSPLTLHNSMSNFVPPSSQQQPQYSSPGGASSTSVAARGSSAARAAAAGTATDTAGTTNNSSGGKTNEGEWPREMMRTFTPRGLATPFSSDINRPSSSGTFLSGSSTVWASPSATPRTSGSVSNRPTPRSGGTAAPGSPRSASSLPTPRITGFHYSIHLLTGKQADALTAAAGFLAARSIEKLFLEFPDFDRRLFYHVNTPKAEETIRAYNLYVATPDKGIGKRFCGVESCPVNMRSTSKVLTSTDGATGPTSTCFSAASPSARPGRATGNNNVSSSLTGMKSGGIQLGLSGGGGRGTSRAGRTLVSTAHSLAGVSQSSSMNLAIAANGIPKGSSLYYITATQEATKELLRELLAAMRPVPVVAPHFGCQAASPASPATAGGGGGTSLSLVPSAPGSISNSSNTHDGEVAATLSVNPVELYSLNALFRVLNGVRVGTPRWSAHASDMTSPLNSSRFLVPSCSSGAANPTSGSAGTNGALTPSLSVGMSSWNHDVLPPFRPPCRGPSASGAADAHATPGGGGTHTGDFKLPLGTSSWLQGPQPLDVHSAAPAGTTTASTSITPTTSGATTTTSPPPPLSSSTSTTPRGLNRLPLQRPWSAEPELKQRSTTSTTSSSGIDVGGQPYSHSSATAANAPRLPALALGNLVSKMHRPTPLNAPPHVSQTATPSLVTSPQQLTSQPKFSLPLEALQPTPAASSSSTANPDAATVVESKASQDVVGCNSHSVSANVRVLTIEQQDENAGLVKHTQPRSVRSSSKQTEWKSGGSPTKKRGSHDPSFAAVSTDVFSRSSSSSGDAEEEEDFNEVYTQQERAQRLKAAQPEATEVLPYLLVGGETAARDRAQLLAKGVTHIVNTVSWCLDNFYPDAFHYLTLNLSDAADEPIFPLFAAVNAFIEKARCGTKSNHNNNNSHSGSGGRVFIHCQQGVSRSCTFVIAYVMWKFGLCYDRAYELVRARRNVCSPNTGFLMNLRLWEAHLATPQLNKIYAYAPYTPESPMPFVYQLVSYYSCSTVSTECTEEPSPESRANYYQLCTDVLRRAVDMRGCASVDTVTLDPRMCYLFLCAPRRSSVTESNADGVDTKAAAKAAEESFDAQYQLEACFLVGETCTQKEYVDQAFASYNDLLQFSFYHGDARNSCDNAGRVVHFAPLRKVRMTPPCTPGAAATTAVDTSPSYTPSAAASVKEAQALLARHVVGRCSIAYAPQPQWEPLLSLPSLASQLTAYVREAAALDAAEAARRALRAAELAKLTGKKEVNHSNTGFTISPSSRASPQPPATAASASASAHLFRSSRHTPRTLRQPQTTAGSAGIVHRSSEAEWLLHNPHQTHHQYALTPPPPLPPQQRKNPRTHSPRLRLKVSALTSGKRDCSVLALSFHPTVTRMSTDSESTGAADERVPHLHVFTPPPPHYEEDGAERCGKDPTDKGSQNASATAQEQLLADAHQLPPHVTGANVTQLALVGGDNFAYAYPFTAATKTVVADLDDLEAAQCYLIGFQQPNGISAYLWRGAESPLEVHEVVRAFAEHMVELSNDVAAAPAAELEFIEKSVERAEWTTCTLHLPHESGEGEHGQENGESNKKDAAAGRGVPAVVMVPNARVLFVEQGEEPEEFVTLL